MVIALATPVYSQSGADRPSDATQPDDVSLLKQQITQQQKEIEQLRAVVEQMKQKLDQSPSQPQSAAAPAPHSAPVASAGNTSPKATENFPVKREQAASALAPKSEPVASASSTSPKAAETSSVKRDGSLVASTVIPSAAVRAATEALPPQEAEQVSPLQFHIGSATITPVGFMDFTGVFHNHAAGGSIGTSFGSIPYGLSATTYQNNLSEIRLSMQNSRIGFRTDADVAGAHVIGYMEADFLGNNGTNVAVTSNSNTLRSRLYWVDLMRGSWEILGGQTWSLLTPGRSGISPLPADVFYTQNMDVNYQAGLFWGRIPELRFVYHPSKKVALALALDSPDQYAGGSSGGPTVVFPTAISSTYSSELDTSASSGGLGAPNVAPDIIAKLAFDPNKRVHFEFGGVERNFKVWYPGAAATKTAAAIPSATFTAEGGGGFLNLHVEIFKGFRLLTNNYWSDGGGRYIFGQAPDVIAHADGSISLIHSGSTVSGFEYTQKKTLIFGYYGGIYVERNTAIDTTGKYVGYGYSGASASQNRAIQEATFGFNQTMWKNAKYGALNLIGQYSYVTRNPWYVAAGQPANASLNEVFLNLRYTLPGSAPTIGGPAR
jgi:uncharacterized coiled-coil protein SlyX